MSLHIIRAFSLCAVLAVTLAAGTAEARCTLGDVKMAKAFPVGNLGRFAPNDQVIIRFALPADCPVANPPLEVCVVVWDNSPCDHEVDFQNQCDGDYVGDAGVFSTGTDWIKTGRARFCRSDMLAEQVGRPGTANTFSTMLISTALGSITNSSKNHLSIIMYNPGRTLVIPIHK